MDDKTTSARRLKEAFRIAEDAANAVSSDDYRVKAFEIAALDQLGSNKNAEQKAQAYEPNGANDKEGGEDDFWIRMSRDAEIETDVLQSIYRLTAEGELGIVLPLESKLVSDTQKTIAYLLMFANRVGRGEDWTSAFDLAEQCREHNALNTHMAKNIKSEKNNIKVTGNKRARKYGLTPSGVKAARRILKEHSGELG